MKKASSIGQSKWDLDTPCLLIDIDMLEGNIHMMKEFASSAEKKLRPHCKTHKCSKIAEIQIKIGAEGLCAAKISEAEILIDKGIKNILVTSPVVSPAKIERLFSCAAKAENFMIVLDNADNADALSKAAQRRNIKLNVLIDIDPGLGRTGVSYDDAPEFARFISELPALSLKGIQCYAGHLQHLNAYQERTKRSLDCMRRAATLFNQLKKEFPGLNVLTGTGTGTYDIDSQIPELTDLQVGSYTVMDAEYMQIGSAENPDRFETFKPALTLLSSVVSANHKRHFTIDAGLKSVYYTPHAPPMVIYPYEKDWDYEWFGDEHGKISVPENDEIPEPGEVIELVVSHCDPTINLHDKFYITKDDIVIDVWDIDLRGCCQ
ncbi:MAG: metal-activated pyridoxal enzyme [Lentisphaerae bacterium GWF2_45_14]|nr:MAG: metal-activated pyridoxal enzyme [Lentisphaerae bacterium GWF2_45_14]